MTRKHFIAIANTISKLATWDARREQAEKMAEICSAANPRFSFIKFYAACNASYDDRNNELTVK